MAMKILTAAMSVILLSATASMPRSQNPPSWVEVSPDEEFFKVQMPQQPRQEQLKNTYGQLHLSGRIYAASAADSTSYALWSFVDLNYSAHPAQDSQAYLDACADLVWESLLKPLRDKLPKDKESVARMTYRSEISNGPLPGREYLIALGDLTGATRFYTADARIYVLVILSGAPRATETENFFTSFIMKTRLPGAATLAADPLVGSDNRNVPNPTVDVGAGGPDYNRVFAPRETTEKTRILSKAEPRYTESARKYGVQGTVVLRAVFSKEALVTNIKVVKGLPHGLTQSAIAAAKGIEFTPASKDGHPVSQYMQLEYNFNLY
jgi:TonB family protein